MLNKIVAETLATKERFNATMLKLTRGTSVTPLLLKKLSVAEAIYLEKFLGRLEVIKAKKKTIDALAVDVLRDTYPELITMYPKMLMEFIAEVKNILCLDAEYHRAKIPLDGLLVETNNPKLAPVLATVAQQFGADTAQVFNNIREIHTTTSELENGRSMPEFGRVFIANDLSENQKAAVLVHENSHLNFYHQYAILIKDVDELVLSIESWANYEKTFGQTAEYFRDGYFRFDMIPVSRLLNELYAHFQEFLYVVQFQLDTANMRQIRLIIAMSRELMGSVSKVADGVAPELAAKIQIILTDLCKVEVEIQNKLAAKYHKGTNAMLNLLSVVFCLDPESFDFANRELTIRS